MKSLVFLVCDFSVVVVIPHFSLAGLLNVVREFQFINIKQTLEKEKKKQISLLYCITVNNKNNLKVFVYSYIFMRVLMK